MLTQAQIAFDQPRQQGSTTATQLSLKLQEVGGAISGYGCSSKWQGAQTQVGRKVTAQSPELMMGSYAPCSVPLGGLPVHCLRYLEAS